MTSPILNNCTLNSCIKHHFTGKNLPTLCLALEMIISENDITMKLLPCVFNYKLLNKSNTDVIAFFAQSMVLMTQG